MISFDLDMTLLDHRTDQITPSALEAIEKLRPKHRIVLATGRDMDNYYSTSYRDIVRPDAIVHRAMAASATSSMPMLKSK